MKFNTCVILAAGQGKRMDSDLPKVLKMISGKPLLGYAIDFWQSYVEHFIFVVGYKKKMVTAYLYERFESNQLNNITIVCQNQQKGIAHAILQVEPYIKGDFVVQLGDCLQKGAFTFPENLESGYGVWRIPYLTMLSRCYAVECKNGVVVHVEEKPSVTQCGMGTYFFNRKVFKYIRKTLPSKLSGEVEITDVLQKMIDAKENIQPVYFEGEFINVTYPQDITAAEAL